MSRPFLCDMHQKNRIFAGVYAAITVFIKYLRVYSYLTKPIA